MNWKDKYPDEHPPVTAPPRTSGPARATVKMRKCKICRNGFVPRSITHKACGPECAQELARLEKAKAVIRAAVEDRKQTRAQLEAMKSLKELRAEAQEAFRWFIRMRDKASGHGCICCGKALDWNSSKPGGSVDAGHFISRGSAPELAFSETNTSAQDKGCNRPGGTTRERFRAGMVARWGESVVAELEGPHEMPHFKHDDYRQMRADYRRRARALEKQIAMQS